MRKEKDKQEFHFSWNILVTFSYKPTEGVPVWKINFTIKNMDKYCRNGSTKKDNIITVGMIMVLSRNVEIKGTVGGGVQTILQWNFPQS